MPSLSSPTIGFGSRVRTSPFFEATRRWGCKAYSVYNRMYIPLFYESQEADYWKLVNDVTLWDVGVQRQVQIAGLDAAVFTQLLIPRDLSKCEVGQCKYVLLVDEQGGIVNDPVLLKLDTDRYWLSLADSDVLLWAKGVAVNAGMDVQITEPDVSPLQLQGPHAAAVARDVFGCWIDDLRYFRFRETELEGIPLVISRTGWSAERGYEIFLCDGSFGDELWERIMDAGRAHGIAPSAPSTIRRIEAGLLSYGADMNLDNNPYEVTMARLVNLEQEASFLGKAALAAIHARGVRRRLVGVEIGGERLPAPNVSWWPAHGGEDRIGELRSCVYTPKLERNIGLAMVSLSYAEEGTRFAVEAPDGARDCRVVSVPFVEKRQV